MVSELGAGRGGPVKGWAPSGEGKKEKGRTKRPGKHGAELRDQVGMGWS